MNPVNGSAHYDFLLSSVPDRALEPQEFESNRNKIRALEPQGFESNRNKIISYSTYAGNMVETSHLPNMYILFYY